MNNQDRIRAFFGYAPVRCCHSQEAKTTVKLFLAALYWHSSDADDAADTIKSSDSLSRYPEFSLKKERTCLNELREQLAESFDPSQFRKTNKSAAKARLKTALYQIAYVHIKYNTCWTGTLIFNYTLSTERKEDKDRGKKIRIR